MKPTRPPREPGKAAPFAASGEGRRPGGRSHRAALTTSIRKARRGETIAKKRHLTLPDVAMGAARPGENPYNKDVDQLKETVEVATSVVRMCSTGEKGETAQSMGDLLDRLCFLLTPEDATDDISGVKASGTLTQESPAGAAYDSSTTAISPNSLLTQFVDGRQGQGQHQCSEQNNLAFLLANALAFILNTGKGDAAMQLKAAVALNQLAAMEPPPPLASAYDQEQYSPHGHPSPAIASSPTSWCYVIATSSALPALVQQIGNPSDIALCEKCVFAIGNLAGDSERVREGLQTMEALPRLIQLLQLGMQQSAEDLIRNTVWALTNWFRGGGMQCQDILAIGDPRMLRNGEASPRLAASDVARLLIAHAYWVEACWFVSLLTNDPAAVDFLCAEPRVVHSLMTNVQLDIRKASQSIQATHNAPLQGVGGMIWCLRALKNIAIASDGRHANHILEMAAADNSPSGESLLVKILSFGTLGAGNEASNIAMEAAALTGTLLYDAGIPLPHPATKACQTLLPALRDALICPLANFEFRREVAWALLDAVSVPRELCETQQVDVNDAMVVQKELLAELMGPSPEDMARTLTTMLSASNMDAQEAALGLIDKLLRRLDGRFGGKSVSQWFEESGLVDALWRVCDSSPEDCTAAELAANILDDYYEIDDEAADEALEPMVTGGQFQFGAAASVPSGGFNFGAAPVPPQGQPPPMGRGRGRGQVLPAWMQQQQQSYE